MVTEAFQVETIELDLPPLVGAFTQRLHQAGLEVTPARTADLARALNLVRPVSRRRLYWTARAVLVSDPTQVAAFDGVFFSIFGGRDQSPPFSSDDPLTTATPADERSCRRYFRSDFGYYLKPLLSWFCCNACMTSTTKNGKPFVRCLAMRGFDDGNNLWFTRSVAAFNTLD